MKDILEIKEISYGGFPEISDWNPRFKSSSKKVKIVVDVQVSEVDDSTDLHLILLKLMKLLPTLEKHQCGEHFLDDLKCGREFSNLPHLEKITHIAHLIEHVIIDLQSRVTGMDSCSGITCGYRNPQFRFDLFVECRDKKVGLFSAFFAVDLFKRLLTNKKLYRRDGDLIDLAKHLYKNKSLQHQNELEPMASQISSDLGWRKGFTLSLLRKLKEFGFFNYREALAT